MRAHALTAAVMFLVATTASAGAVWVPIAAHADGVGGSAWRTDVTLASDCDRDTTAEIRLHRNGGVSTIERVVPAGASLTLDDVVALLTTENAAGALEIVSEEALSVRSRTFNSAINGTFGQALDAVEEEDGLDFGRSATVSGLRETEAFRSNLGFLNMGDIAAKVAVELRDGAGASIGTYEIEVPVGEVVQDGRPFALRFGRSDVTSGYARIRVERGTDVFVYGSVIDNATGDPTTVAMNAGTLQRLSNTSRLAAAAAIDAHGIASDGVAIVRENLPLGSEVVETKPGGDGEVLLVPGLGGPWHLVVLDDFPNSKYGHPMTWLLVESPSGIVTSPITVGYLPRIDPPSASGTPELTAIAEGSVDGIAVRTVSGDGWRVDVDTSHKPAFVGEDNFGVAAAPLRTPINVGMVFDGGGAGAEQMSENDADPMENWLKEEDFTVSRFSQYPGNEQEHFETGISFRKAIREQGTRFTELGAPDGGACDNYFLYITAHGTTTKGTPNPGFDVISVDAPGQSFTLNYSYLLDSFSTFPAWVKVTIFIDACYSGQLLDQKEKIKELCAQLCALTLITTSDSASQTAASNSFIDSSTEDFLEGATKDHDGDGNVGDIQDRFKEMEKQKVIGSVLSEHCPDCKTWCILDGAQEVESACADSTDEYIVAVTDVVDPGGHDGFDGDPLGGALGFLIGCPTTSVTGDPPFVPVTGTTTSAGSFLVGEGPAGLVGQEAAATTCGFAASGRGTVAGFSDIAVAMEGTISGDTILGSYSLGVEGGLPGGEAITYIFEATVTP